jgi:hypothetical protein
VRSRLGGLDAAVTARGDQLSLGEKQLLCIARVFLCKVNATAPVCQTRQGNSVKLIRPLRATVEAKVRGMVSKREDGGC